MLLVCVLALHGKCCKSTCAPQSSARFDCIPKTTEYIIVGLGTAGATLARYLSDPINGEYVNNVVVLEAGQNYNQDEAVLNPNLFASSMLGASNKYSDTFAAFPGAQANFGFNLLGYTEGRMWGGGSGHNGMIAVRGTPGLYDQWAAASGASHWSYNNLLPLMKFLERYQENGGGFDPVERGASGALTITQDDNSLVTTNAFITNTMSTIPGITLPIVGDYNIPAGALGINALQMNNTQGQFDPASIRTFSANAFLPTPADNPTNPIISEDGKGLNGRKLQIISNAYVARVIFDGNVAVGVEYIFQDEPEKVITLYATKEVILCAGSIQDVAILQRSGIGPQAVLDDLGIESVVYNDNVGAHLKNHYGSSCIMTANTDPNNIAPSLPVQFFSDGRPYFTGPDGERLIQSLFGAGPFFFYDLGIPIALVGAQVLDVPTFPTNSFGLIILNPKATGSVVIADTNPLSTPVVNFGFWDDYNPLIDPIGDFPGSDFDAIVSSFKIIRDIAHACGETMIYPTEAMFTQADSGDNSSLMLAAQFGTFVTYHAAGTCRMATSAVDGVVNGSLQVFGVNNLRIADCSVMPRIVDGNTALAAYYIGAALAKLLGNQTLPNI